MKNFFKVKEVINRVLLTIEGNLHNGRKYWGKKLSNKGVNIKWASPVAQTAMWETWVHSLGWEDPLEKGKVTHSSNSMD